MTLLLLFVLAVQEKSAKDLLQDSLKQAAEGKKRVLLTFGAPG